MIHMLDVKKIREDFIIFCGGVINIADVIPKKKKKKVSTHNETLKLWEDGRGIRQIAEIRALSEKTIFGHIEDLVQKGKIKRTDLARIVPAHLTHSLLKIHSVFRDLNTDKLTPVFDKFQGRYSYDELKLARMLMERK